MEQDMTFDNAIRTVYQKYAIFDGRAGRPEFWWFNLYAVLTNVAITVVFAAFAVTVDAMGEVAFHGVVALLWSLANLLPSLAVSVRRLHDIGKSGWWLLITLIPLAGVIIFIVWLCQKSDTGDNAYGPQTA
jgi:uncharacterized membrane protein YhaH (DUF805 family)